MNEEPSDASQIVSRTDWQNDANIRAMLHRAWVCPVCSKKLLHEDFQAKVCIFTAITGSPPPLDRWSELGLGQRFEEMFSQRADLVLAVAALRHPEQMANFLNGLITDRKMKDAEWQRNRIATQHLRGEYAWLKKKLVEATTHEQKAKAETKLNNWKRAHEAAWNVIQEEEQGGSA